MQYCCLQHQTLLLSPVTSTIEYSFLLWLHPIILSGVISPLISSSILGTYRPGEFPFQYPIILPFHTVHGVLKARKLKWFSIPFSSGPHSVIIYPAIYLEPNYGGGYEDNDDLLQKIPCMYCYTRCSQPCSRPPLTHASARDSWTLTGKSGSVSCGVTAPFFWVLVHTRFCLYPPRGLKLSC